MATVEKGEWGGKRTLKKKIIQSVEVQNLMGQVRFFVWFRSSNRKELLSCTDCS